MRGRSAHERTLARPDVADDAPKRAERVPVQPAGLPADVARFAEIVATRLLSPLTPAEAQVLFLRIDRLMDSQQVEELTGHLGCVNSHMARAYVKLGFARRRGERGVLLPAVLAWYHHERGLRDARTLVQRDRLP